MPTRFDPDTEQSHLRFACIPFGAGPRVRIGQNFALVEAIAMLAVTARHLCVKRAPSALHSSPTRSSHLAPATRRKTQDATGPRLNQTCRLRLTLSLLCARAHDREDFPQTCAA